MWFHRTRSDTPLYLTLADFKDQYTELEMWYDNIPETGIICKHIKSKEIKVAYPWTFDKANYTPLSKTETFAAAKLLIDNWRWEGVPIYLRSGKGLWKRGTEIVVEFKKAERTPSCCKATTWSCISAISGEITILTPSFIKVGS